MLSCLYFFSGAGEPFRLWNGTQNFTKTGLWDNQDQIGKVNLSYHSCSLISSDHIMHLNRAHENLLP